MKTVRSAAPVNLSSCTVRGYSPSRAGNLGSRDALSHGSFAADTGVMEETDLDELREELALLVAEEQRLSADRSRLQHQIDFGFTSDTTRGREREVSDERRRLHERIDALRRQLRS
jgi:hypothetical protein